MAAIPRVVLTGSESTGKTTLASRLAAHYGTAWVPEFARTYAAERGGVLSADDVEPIARGQAAAEAAAIGHGLLILDTDLLSTAVYARHYYDRRVDWLEAAIGRQPTLYLLCDIDLPWEADGIRDRGEDRDRMQELFRRALAERSLPFAVVSGLGPARLARAITATDQWVRAGFTLP